MNAPANGARSGPAVWARDLAMGMRFAAGGGRGAGSSPSYRWAVPPALTALGVALGVAVLLLGASVPSLTSAWHGREKARENLLFVTALSLPPLWRMMRPDGLRTE
ncbi:hypothetical protein [Streptomyces natalensis]|uniref:ABC transporter permease n=1 Tax=Streptomyces natalensis ATCC 27448 TaxID=1240678 RepID=A0A0D7CEN3_9ACTN|nr:hypothetical protein SNA_35095 [Streptomyces natalensis ATCC 27448]